MALDEAVLDAVARGDVAPTLRLYAWHPPCISSGYGQNLAEFDRARLAADGIGLVRRPSGGRAVLHKDELTYCLCVPEGDRRVTGGVLESYRRTSDGLLEGLRRLGVPSEMAEGRKAEDGASAACFDSPSRYELTATGRKLVGSAQWRHNGGVLQHGSVPLNGDVTELVDYLALDEAERERARDVLRRRAGTVSQALGRTVCFSEVAAALSEGLAGKLDIEWVSADLSGEELLRAEVLAREKYGSQSWLTRS